MHGNSDGHIHATVCYMGADYCGLPFKIQIEKQPAP